MLWTETPEKPNVAAPTASDSTVAPWIVGKRCMRSTTDAAPVRWMACESNTCTGKDASASTRRMAEPVTITSSNGAPADVCFCSCATASDVTRRIGVVQSARPKARLKEVLVMDALLMD
ncbi:hypothetical protein GCM10011488_58090 [Steroidobacter agaridevorans]|nr:hypothetical protein GCM10011488_58090 [Steroidobacter agaridevorans]